MIPCVLVVRGELRKLRNPVTILLLIVALAFLWSDIKSTMFLARLQPAIAVSNAPTLASSILADPEKPAVSSTDGQPSVASLNENFVRNALVLGSVGQSLNSGPGLLRFVSNQFGTGLGWLLAGALSALLSATEISKRTIEATRSAVGSGARIVLAKALAVWTTLLTALLATASLLFLLRGAFFRPARIPDPPVQAGAMNEWRMRSLPVNRDWISLASTTRAVLIACVSLFLASVFFVTIGLVVGRTLAALAVNASIVFAMFLVSEVLHRPALTPQRSVASLLGLGSTFGVFDSRAWDRAGRPTEIGLPAVTRGASAWSVSVWCVLLLGSTILLYLAARRARRL